MWPHLQEKPECIKDPNPTAGLARSWTATLSEERLPFTLEVLQAIRKVAMLIEQAQTECEGLWMLCDEHGTWVILTYPTAREPQVAARNLRQILKPLGIEVLATMEKTRRYFNESHQARIQRLQIRREIIYKAEVIKTTTVTKPKACKQNLAQWALMMDGTDDGHGIDVTAPSRSPAFGGKGELTLAVPPYPMVASPFQGSIVCLMDEAEHININLQKLTNAREQYRAERDELNERGGEAESLEHLEYEAKHSKVLAHDQAIKQAHAEYKRMQAKITSMNEAKEDLVEECDKEHEDTYALWLLGDCGYLQPPCKIFIKSMREEKDREMFLREELLAGEDVPNQSQGVVDEVLIATIKKTKQLQDECVFPKDANSHDRARTRKRIAKVCVAMTGEEPDAKRINKMLDKEEGCHQCGAKGIKFHCKKEGGPVMCIEKIWHSNLSERADPTKDPLISRGTYTMEEPSPGESALFCTEDCAFQYRLWPVCGQCKNSDKKNMYIKNKDLNFNGNVEFKLECPADLTGRTEMRSFGLHFPQLKDYQCTSCNARCHSRDPGVWNPGRYGMGVVGSW